MALTKLIVMHQPEEMCSIFQELELSGGHQTDELIDRLHQLGWKQCILDR